MWKLHLWRDAGLPSAQNNMSAPLIRRPWTTKRSIIEDFQKVKNNTKFSPSLKVKWRAAEEPGHQHLRAMKQKLIRYRSRAHLPSTSSAVIPQNKGQRIQDHDRRICALSRCKGPANWQISRHDSRHRFILLVLRFSIQN